MKKFNSWLKERKSVITRLAILAFLLAALPLTLFLNSQRQDARQRADTLPSTNQYCGYETWSTDGDFLRGNNSLGTEKHLFPLNDPDPDHKDSMGPGPVIEKGQPVKTTRYKYDGSEDWAITHGPIMILRYDPNKDIIRGSLSGRSYTESNWSLFLRRMDGNYFSTYSSEIVQRKISTGVVMKYTIMSIIRGAIDNLVDEKGGSEDSQGTSATQSNKNLTDFLDGKLKVVNTTFRTVNADGTRSSIVGQTITIELLTNLIGFDVTELKPELIKTLASIRENGSWNMQEVKDKMITDSSICNAPTPIPTATTPVSCDEHLTIPTSTFAVNLPSFTPNICSQATEYDPTTGHAKAQELLNCGDYWVTRWCDGNDTAKFNVTYACRGWSQEQNCNADETKPNWCAPNETNGFYRYFPNRISTITTSKGASGDGGALLSNITKYGDVRGRRITWNNLMHELTSGGIAFPYGYKDTAGALQAAAAAIFDKPWGAVVEQERLNNCSITGAPTVTPGTSITPVVTPTTNDEQPITNDGDARKDLNPKVVKDAQNNVYVTWESDGIVEYSKGIWNGNNYTFSNTTPIGAKCASQGCKPGIAVNSAGTKVMIAWGADPNLSIFTWDGTPGISTGTSTPMKYPMGFGLEPNIAVDSQGVFHLVANGDNKTKYCKYDIASGTCSDTKEFTETLSHPEIAVDSSDNIHIVSSGNSVINYYTKKNGDTTFTTKQLDNGGNGQQITADKQGNVYITWSKDFNIQICKKTINTDCSASNTQTVTDGQATNPSVGVTSNGDVLVAYASSNQVLKYVKYTGGSWSHPANVGQQGSVAVDISPLSYDNKLSAVWSQNWDIWHKFFTFDEGTRVKVTLGLDGIGSAGDYANTQANDKSNKKPKTPTRPLALQFYDEQNNLMFTKIGSVTYDQQSGDFTGNISVGNDLAEGTKFFIKAKMDQYLLKNLPGFIFKLNDQNTFVRNTLTTGDINGDNKLSVLDYNVLSDCYSDINTTPHACSDANKKLSDLNDDGNVNQIDYNLFVRELPKQQGD